MPDPSSLRYADGDPPGVRYKWWAWDDDEDPEGDEPDVYTGNQTDSY